MEKKNTQNQLNNNLSKQTNKRWQLLYSNDQTEKCYGLHLKYDFHSQIHNLTWRPKISDKWLTVS